MKSYVLIGPKKDKFANCLTEKRKVRSTLKRYEEVDGPSEIKKEFKAPSWEVARIVYESYNGWIIDMHQFIKDLTKYFGYKVEKINGTLKMARSGSKNKQAVPKGRNCKS